MSGSSEETMDFISSDGKEMRKAGKISKRTADPTLNLFENYISEVLPVFIQNERHECHPTPENAT